MLEEEYHPPLSEPVRLLLERAEGIMQSRGASKLAVTDVADAFRRRYGGILERLGSLDASTAPTGRRDSAWPSVDVFLEEAARRAAESGASSTDLRHLGAVLVESSELASVLDPGSEGGKGAPRRSSTGRSRQGDGALLRVGRDLTAAARDGELPVLVERDGILEEVLEVLCRRLKRSPLIVGRPGVGKTSVVWLLAQRIAAGDVPGALKDARVVEVSVQKVLSAARDLPEFVKVMSDVIREASNPDVVLFFDDLQAAMSAGGPEHGVVAQLRPALAEGRIACVAAMLESDFQRRVAADGEFGRLFEPVRLQAPDRDGTIRMLRASAASLTDEPLDVEVLEAVVDLSDEYLRGREQPYKSVDVLDRVVARARLRDAPPTIEAVADVIAAMTGLPLGSGASALSARLDGLGAFLRSRIVGQDGAIETLASHLALKVRNLDLRPERPNGVFLCAGPTGVGKTELARATAEWLFGSESRLIRLDMSEFAEPHSIAKLLGAPPGYVGYDQGAPLLEELASRPFAVVLLDEIEKAHPDVHKYFLQVFDDGFLTSNAGQRVYFSDAVIIMTSNLAVSRTKIKPGFAGGAEAIDALDLLTETFPPEFVNRIDAVCEFKPLQRADVEHIVREVTLRKWQNRRENRSLNLEVSDEALSRLASMGYNERLGVRELQRVVERDLLNQIPALVAPGEACDLRADCEGERIIVRSLERKEKRDGV